jgi:hypothetical protein
MRTRNCSKTDGALREGHIPRSDGWGQGKRIDPGVQRSLGVAEFSGSSGGLEGSEAAAFG